MENWERIAAKVNQATAPPPISKAQLARNIGLTRQALQRRINQGGWKYEELKRLAAALNTTVDELVGDDTPKPSDQELKALQTLAEWAGRTGEWADENTPQSSGSVGGAAPSPEGEMR